MLYTLKCQSCQEDIPVAEKHAGEFLTCRCGATVEVPTLRRLRELPQRDEPDRQPGRVWTRAQGVLFAIGLMVLAVALLAVALFGIWRSQLKIEPIDVKSLTFTQDFAKLTPTQAWDAWVEDFRYYELGERAKPMHIHHRDADRHYLWGQLVGAVLAIFALGAMVGAYIMRPQD